MSESEERARRALGDAWERWGLLTAHRVRRRMPEIARLAAVVAVAYVATEAIYFGSATLALATLAPWLPEIKEADSSLAWALHSLATPALTVFFLALTMLGSGYGNIALTSVFGWTFACRRAVLRGAALAFLMIGASGLSEITKLLVQRVRPEEFRLATAPGYSFPSGHALMATCLYGGLALLLWRRARRRRERAALFVGAVVLAISIGLSRVYLGVHYPTDVVGGWVGGLLWLFAFRQSLSRFARGQT